MKNLREILDLRVVILAGMSQKQRAAWPGLPPEGKSHLPICGQPMMHAVMLTLRDIGLLYNVVIGDWIPNDEKVRNILYLHGFDNQTDTVKRVLDVLVDDEYALFITCDIPLVSQEGLCDFIVKSIASEADVTVAAIDVVECKKVFPSSHSTTWFSNGKETTMGNAMLIRLQTLRDNMELVDKAIHAKKNIKALAQILGISFFLRFLLGQILSRYLRRFWLARKIGIRLLSLDYIQGVIQKRIGVKLMAIPSKDAGLGFDADGPDSYRILADKAALLQ